MPVVILGKVINPLHSMMTLGMISYEDFGWLTIIPPLLAIGLAIATHQVILALLIGCLAGLFIMHGMDLTALGAAFLNFPGEVLPDVLTNTSHISIIIFSLLISGMVALVSKNGGITGVVSFFRKFVDSIKKANLMTGLFGLFIFFDDYANTLLVGNSMRSVVDRFKISREKLAYIVDSVAAPLAAIALVTTWIGAQLGYVESALIQTGIEKGGYQVFLSSLSYAFYPFFALFLVFLVILSGRDFGPMVRFEEKARVEEGTSNNWDNDEGKFNEQPNKSLNAVLPILVLIGGVLGGLFYTGYMAADTFPDFTFWNAALIMGEGDSYQALLWASFFSFVVAGIQSWLNSPMTLSGITEEAIKGFNSITGAILILTLAWSLSEISRELGTATYLAESLKDTVPYYLFPLATFLLSAIVAFATGSSWGTMAIIYPLFLPFSYELAIGAGAGQEEALVIFYQVVAAVLGGSVFGDHCSPLSDTTILSSMSSGCDHMDHVNSQLPYALVGGVVSLITGYGVTMFFPELWWLGFLAGFAIMGVFLLQYGKKV